MSRFNVTVRTPDQQVHHYPALARTSFEVHACAIDRFGICSVFIILA